MDKNWPQSSMMPASERDSAPPPRDLLAKTARIAPTVIVFSTPLGLYFNIGVPNWIIAGICGLTLVWLVSPSVVERWRRSVQNSEAQSFWSEVKEFEQRARKLIREFQGPLEVGFEKALDDHRADLDEISPRQIARTLARWLEFLSDRHSRQRSVKYEDFEKAVGELVCVVSGYYNRCLIEPIDCMRRAEWLNEIPDHKKTGLNAAIERWNHFLLEFEKLLNKLDSHFDKQTYSYSFDPISKI